MSRACNAKLSQPYRQLFGISDKKMPYSLTLGFREAAVRHIVHFSICYLVTLSVLVGLSLGFCYRAVKVNVTGIIQLEAVGYNIISRSRLVADALQL